MRNGEIRYIHTKDIHNLNAPSILVPYLYKKYKPKSVVDIGAGLCNWLKIFQNLGVNKVLGLDGDWVDLEKLLIDIDHFKKIDLRENFNFDEKYDLAICLEVAEHLEPEYAQSFIKNICGLSDTVVFSAAIPGQGGQNHVNEQPPEYWSNFFQELEFGLVEDFRDNFWDDERIDWWYRQNILVYSKLKPEGLIDVSPVYKIHPKLWVEELNRKQYIINNFNKLINETSSWKGILKLILIKFGVKLSK